MDFSYIAAAPALARLHEEHHQHPDRTKHRLDANQLRRERTYLRRILRRARIRRTFADLAPAVPSPSETRPIGALG
jgi:hypothetical protein